MSKIHFENEQDIAKIKMKDYDEEERNEISKISIKTKIIKDNTTNKISNNNNLNINNIGKEYIEKDIEDNNNFISKNNLQYGENGKFFRNNDDKDKYLLRGKNDKNNDNVKSEKIKNEEEQDKINEISDLNPSMIKSNEFDTYDKLANTEKSLLRQIGNDTQDNKSKTQNIDSLRNNKLHGISTDKVEYQTLPQNNNYIIESNEEKNIKNGLFNENE